MTLWTERPIRPRVSNRALSATPTPSVPSSERASRQTHGPTAGRSRWMVRSGLMNVWVSHGSTRLTPLPKSAAAATRCSALGSSPATTGTLEPDPHRHRSGVEPGPGGEAVLDAVVVEGDVVVGEAADLAPGALGPGRRLDPGRAAGPRGIDTGADRIRRARALATSLPDRGVTHRRLDQLHLAARSNHLGLQHQGLDRHRAEQLDREPGDLEGDPVRRRALDRPSQQRPCGAAVEGMRVPWTAREVRGDRAGPRRARTARSVTSAAGGGRRPRRPGGRRARHPAARRTAARRTSRRRRRRRRRCGGPASAARPG